MPSRKESLAPSMTHPEERAYAAGNLATVFDIGILLCAVDDVLDHLYYLLLILCPEEMTARQPRTGGRPN